MKILKKKYQIKKYLLNDFKTQEINLIFTNIFTNFNKNNYSEKKIFDNSKNILTNLKKNIKIKKKIFNQKKYFMKKKYLIKIKIFQKNNLL